jgi:hypothetical protein
MEKDSYRACRHHGCLLHSRKVAPARTGYVDTVTRQGRSGDPEKDHGNAPPCHRRAVISTDRFRTRCFSKFAGEVRRLPTVAIAPRRQLPTSCVAGDLPAPRPSVCSAFGGLIPYCNVRTLMSANPQANERDISIST